MTRPPPFELERYFDAHEFSGVGLLGSSDCETITVGELLALEPSAADRLANLRLGYTTAAGDPELRELICGLYEDTTPENILVHASGVEPILNVLQAATNPGDAVIIQTPIYGAAPGVAAWLDLQVRSWPLREGPAWHADLGLLRDLLGTGARLVYLNTPHNPTGWHARADELAEIADLCARHDALLFVDEVYRDSEYRDDDRLPGACDLGPHCVSLGVLSKSYGLAGLRLGWLATANSDLLAAVTAIKDYTSICTSAPSEFLAKIALHRRSTILARLRSLISENLNAVDRLIAAHGDLLSWSRPMAGPVGFLRLTEDLSAQAFCDSVRTQAGIMLVLSSVFAWGDRHVRIGFGRKDCPELIDRLDLTLHRFK